MKAAIAAVKADIKEVARMMVRRPSRFEMVATFCLWLSMAAAAGHAAQRVVYIDSQADSSGWVIRG